MKAAGSSFIPVDILVDGSDFDDIVRNAKNAAAKIYASLPAEFRDGTNSVGLNIAGNGLYTLQGMTQDRVNDLVTMTLVCLQNAGARISSLRSGGQTGVDEAAGIAGRTLGIPVRIHAPQGWKFRDVNGVDHSDEKLFKSRFALTDEMKFNIDRYRIIGKNHDVSIDLAKPILFKTADGKFNYMRAEDRSVLLRNDVDTARFFDRGHALVSLNGVRLEINDGGLVTRNLTHDESIRQDTGHSIK